MTFSWDAVDWNLLAALSPLLVLCFVGALIALACEKKIKRAFHLLILMACFAAFFSFLIMAQAWGPWEVAAEGVYDHADYRQVDEHHLAVFGGTRAVTVTLIYWSDGRTYEVPRIESMPFAKGTPIRILTKNGKYKIERRN